MRISSIFLLGAALVLSSACAQFTTVRHSAGYKKTLQAHNELTLLPAEAIVNTVDVGNNRERMYNYEYHIEDILSQEATQTLKSKGYRIKPLRKKDIHDQKLSDIVIDLRRQYNKARNELYTPPIINIKQAGIINKVMSEKAVELGKKTHSPVLVMLDYEGAVKTNGARARDFAIDFLIGTTNGDNVDSAAMVLSIIDASTGKLLWSNKMLSTKSLIASGLDSASNADKLDKERANILLQYALKQLPDKDKLSLPDDEKAKK